MVVTTPALGTWSGCRNKGVMWWWSLTLHPLGYHVAAAVDHHHFTPFTLQPDQVPKAGVVITKGAAADLYHYWVARSRLPRQFFLQSKKLRSR